MCWSSWKKVWLPHRRSTRLLLLGASRKPAFLKEDAHLHFDLLEVVLPLQECDSLYVILHHHIIPAYPEPSFNAWFKD